MIEAALVVSLEITAIYVLFQQGNLFGSLRIAAANFFDRIFGKKLSRYIQKPLWDCLPCMSSVWTLFLTICVSPLSIIHNPAGILELILVVCGINYLIAQTFLNDEGEVGEPRVDDVL